MDEGHQPLTNTEANSLQAEQELKQVEAQTGTTAIPRTDQTHDTPADKLDPRFDEDDLRQGKVPPAVRKHRRLRVLRKRANKGAPLSKDEKAKALAGNGDEHLDAAEMTEEEIDMTDDEEDTDDDRKKKSGLFGKILGKA